jgi:hypothetical protein
MYYTIDVKDSNEYWQTIFDLGEYYHLSLESTYEHAIQSDEGYSHESLYLRVEDDWTCATCPYKLYLSMNYT